MAAQLEKEVTWELLGGTGDRSEMPRRREGQAREGQQKATQKEVGETGGSATEKWGPGSLGHSGGVVSLRSDQEGGGRGW